MRRSWPRYVCLTKNQNAPRPYDHPPVRGEKLSSRLGVEGTGLILPYLALIRKCMPPFGQRFCAVPSNLLYQALIMISI